MNKKMKLLGSEKATTIPTTTTTTSGSKYSKFVSDKQDEGVGKIFFFFCTKNWFCCLFVSLLPSLIELQTRSSQKPEKVVSQMVPFEDIQSENPGFPWNVWNKIRVFFGYEPTKPYQSK